MAVLGFEDLEGTVEVVVFPDTYKKAGELVEGRAIWMRGMVNVKQNGRNRKSDDEPEEEERQIQAEEIVDIASVSKDQTTSLEVIISESDLGNTEKLEALQRIASANKGKLNLILRLMSPRYGEVIAQCAQKYSIANEPQVIEQVEKLFGENSAKPSNRTKRLNKRNASQIGFV